MYPSVKDLSDVNRDVNLLPYQSDAERYQREDFWTELDKNGGDCEDFAIAKIHRLSELNWPIERMRLACCFVETGEYHAILVVDTGDGQEVVLDNRQNGIMNLDELVRKQYIPDMIQKEGGSKTWVEWLWKE